MILKKLLTLILLIFAVYITQSCEKNEPKKPRSWKRPKIDRILTETYLDIADKHRYNSEYDKAYLFYYKAKSSAECKKDTSRIVYSLIRLASIHFNQADYIECESLLTHAESLLKNKKDHYYNFNIYMMLGNGYNNIFDFENAQLYYEKAKQFGKISSLDKIQVNNNIAAIYLEKKNFSKAAQILEPLTIRKELKKDQAEYSRVLCNLGYCYYQLGNPKALDYLKTSLLIRTKINDVGVGLSSIYLSDYYTKKDIKKANQYAELSFKLAKKIKNSDDQLYSLKQLITINSGEKAKEYSLMYITLNDSLNRTRQIAKNQFAKIRYDSKTEREENLKLKIQKAENALEIESHKNKNMMLLFLSIVGVTATLYLYCFWKRKNKKEKFITAYETETQISKRLHDELANDVYNTMMYAETQDLNQAEIKGILLKKIETIYDRTRNIALENSEIDTSENFKSNLILLISSYNNDKTNIIIKNPEVINWSKINKKTKITIYRILQELLVNMKKHSDCSIAIIGFESKEKTYEINYSDNGIGSAKTFKFKNGLQNVENRIKNINGIFTFDTETNKGFQAKIIFPN